MIEKDIDLLDIDLTEMKKNIIKECLDEGVLPELDDDDIESLLNDAIEIELEERKNRSYRDRRFIQKKNGVGVYVSIKNIHISLEVIVNFLILIKNFEPLAVVIFLCNLFKQLLVDINRWQMSIYTILYDEGKKYAITDDNIIEVVKNKIKEYGYEKENSQRIMDTINELYNLEMITIDDGFYKAEEKICL